MEILKKRFDELSPYKMVHHDINARYPIHIEIDPTSTCQQNCLRCSYKQDIDGRRDYIIHREGVSLPYLRFKELISEFKELGMKAITLSGGGEPLMYPHIKDIIQDIFSADLQLGIISNLAVKVDTELLSHSVWIRVSLDAAVMETYNLLHRPSNRKAFDLVLENIRHLSNYRKSLDLGINYLIQPENYKEVYSAALLAKDLGASYIRFVPAIATDVIDYDDLFPKIEKKLQKSLYLIDEKFHVFIIRERLDSLADKRKTYSFCYKQQIHPLLGADGNIYPCCLLKYYPKHVLGSIYHESFKSVWDGETRKAWLNALNVHKCPPCWFDKTNEFIEYMLIDNPKHVDFV